MKRGKKGIMMLLVASLLIAMTSCGSSNKSESDGKPAENGSREKAVDLETTNQEQDGMTDDAYVSNGVNEEAKLAKVVEGEGDKEFNTEDYGKIDENELVSPLDQPLSTFSISVDTASYSLVRGKLNSGQEIGPDMVRLEEFVNYFHYDYEEPKDGSPLSVYTELGTCPWNEERDLLLVGLKGTEVDLQEAPPCNLVFLVDTSGSMDEANKLPLVQEAFLLLADNLRAKDRISIVTYAGSSEVILNGATAEDKLSIDTAINGLFAEGSTNGEGGIETAYRVAEENYIDGGANRVILATDGDFNVGVSSDGELSRMISKKRETGVFLSIMGFGYGNYKDNKMETLSKDGNGNAYYIDNLLEARKVLVEQMGGTLVTIAKDVKLQLEFNPSAVKVYRLLGYEHRLLNAKDFADDKKDAGEIGSGHTVTALYEIVPADSKEEVPTMDLKYQSKENKSSDELANVALRYKLPEADKSTLKEESVMPEGRSNKPSDNFIWAASVAEVAMALRDSENKGNTNIKRAIRQANAVTSVKADPYKQEFLDLFDRYVKTH